MAAHSASLDFTRALSAPQTCPGCEAAELDAAVDGDRTSFLCQRCGRCWRHEYGYAFQVDPHGCSECRHRPQCLALAEQRPSDGQRAHRSGTIAATASATLPR